MRYYVGLTHKGQESDLGVSFPDFPGVVTAGTGLDEALAMVEEALTFHVEGLLEDGGAIPAPSSLEDVMADKDNRSGFAIMVAWKPTKRSHPDRPGISIWRPSSSRPEKPSLIS
ncbi:type II toxin-antitoxin system HicB family antitoxin [Mesorhizobium sp. M0222]|uniref:type II toxin-antitoxin system HicB family antitoxin n=1 Tax=Mesorhizobium sp. M0222 TaxID=2956921 RepID=UPI00333AF8D1